MITIGTAQIYVGGKFVTFTLYKAGSAENHRTADDLTLKTALTKALNARDYEKEAQGGGVFRYRINNGQGYLVYRTPAGIDPNSACVFHYHWNYHLDLPLSAT
jgi:hypothetical protein